MTKKVAVFTGTRAEYGLLYWVMRGVLETKSLELQVFAGGMHLSKEFGYTIDVIENDGFLITEKMEFLLSSDTPVGVSKSLALAIMSASEAFERHRPDIVVLLGDRFEALAVAQAAMLACIPIAHIHGGETTEGLIDEAIRHSITKLSHLHFAATEPYRKRIIQLGEHPKSVFNVGAPGIDNIERMEFMTVSELSSVLGVELAEGFFVVTYHPVTLNSDGGLPALENLLQALNLFPDFKCIISYPNADTHGRNLINAVEQYQSDNSDRVILGKSLGQQKYLSLLKHCDAVIGNSSSGLIEAPSFKVPTINIGHRQAGRIAGDTVIQCSDDKKSIILSIQKAITEDFKLVCQNASNPYGEGGSSDKIVHIIESYPLEGIIHKTFYDLEG